MKVFESFSELQLDIVSIVAILGEASTSRNAQASALSWHHILPRLYPAPQSLLKHHQDKRLPIESGIVVGALTGRIRNDLNFFTTLLHNRELGKYEVQMLEVMRRKERTENDQIPGYQVKKLGHLSALSVLGCCMSATLLALSIWQDDGPALLATVFLSATSSLVGLASWCVLKDDVERPDDRRRGNTPHGDVVIFYPRTGAFRIVHCSDEIFRLYFHTEMVEHYFGDNTYRAIALISTALLMGGLIMLSNSHPILQMAFAAAYVLLNALYWMSSALNPATHVWEHKVSNNNAGKPALTTALWTAIALTGTSRWARSTNIAPNDVAWDRWLKEADANASARRSESRSANVPPCTSITDASGQVWVQLPLWDYQARLSQIFREQSEETKIRRELQAALNDIDEKINALQTRLWFVIRVRIAFTRYQARRTRP